VSNIYNNNKASNAKIGQNVNKALFILTQRLVPVLGHVRVKIEESLNLLSWSWSYGSWIYNYLYNQCLSPLKLWINLHTKIKWNTDKNIINGKLGCCCFPQCKIYVFVLYKMAYIFISILFDFRMQIIINPYHKKSLKRYLICSWAVLFACFCR
jgi:hypothetical protein